MPVYKKKKTIAHIRHVVSVPETIDFTPSELISPRLSGAMVPRPPIMMPRLPKLVFFFQAEDGIRDYKVTGVQTCALPISWSGTRSPPGSWSGPGLAAP